MKTEIQITLDDFLDARRLSLRPQRKLRITLYVLSAFIGLFVIYGAYNTIFAGVHELTWLWPVGVVAYLVFVYYGLIPWTARRIYKQQKGLHEPFIVELTEDEIRMTSSRGSLCMKYQDFHKWIGQVSQADAPIKLRFRLRQEAALSLR